MTGNRIDVHAHYLGSAGPGIGRGNYKMPVQWTPEATLAHMDRHEVAAQILSTPWAPMGSEPPGFATRFCRGINEECAELIAKHPGRFGAFTIIPLDNSDVALAEIAYGLDELGLDGVVLTTNSLGRYFGHPVYEPILADLNRRRVPVFVHPTFPPHIDELGFGRPPSVVEFPFDTARTITNALYTGVFQRYPDLRLILAHAGGALPTLGWRIAEHTVIGRSPDDPNIGRAPGDADIDPDHVTEVLRGLYYDTALAGGPHSLQPALQVTSADHILFGTDWPVAPESTIAHNIDNLNAFGFPDTEFAGIERDNAIRLFPRFA